MRTAIAPAIVLALLAIPGFARAQDKPTLITDYTRSKSNVVAYVDAMPEALLGFRPTPEVRSFAQQIEHIVVTHYEVAAMTLGSVEQPAPLGDSAVYLHNKAALRAVSVKAFDYALAELLKATPAMLAKSAAIYGQDPAPAWKWMVMSLEHGAWTRGQTVPYLRRNRITPPTYLIPF